MVSSTEKALKGEAATADGNKKFKTCSKALSMIVLSMKSELHFSPEESPTTQWLFRNNFKCKIWDNHHRQKIREQSVGTIEGHIDALSLARLENLVTENKQVMFIFASLPERLENDGDRLHVFRESDWEAEGISGHKPEPMTTSWQAKCQIVRKTKAVWTLLMPLQCSLL